MTREAVVGGFTLSEQDVATIQTVVDRCREVGDEPISAAVLEALGQVLETDRVSVAGFCAASGRRSGSAPGLTDRDRFILTLLRPHLADHHARWLRAHPQTVPLTRRQLAVLDLVRDGYTNDQIGRRLNLSEGTVRTHLNHVYERLGVASRTAAVTAVYGDAEAG
jgi:DNA-binding NarL/FixJ family response regulator